MRADPPARPDPESGFVLRASSFFRHSDFVIRHCPDGDEAQVEGYCQKVNTPERSVVGFTT